jgi:5S rRNA maturation endonuclease (ribonuclease M5)
MSLIIDTVQSYLPAKRKITPSGWVSFNAVCCHHNGTSADNRQRGGIMVNEGVSYHCFNCGFKASWQPGRKVSVKLKRLMQWLGVPDDAITKCSLEALRFEEDLTYQGEKSLIPVFIDKALPLGTEPIVNFLDNPPDELLLVMGYLIGRNLYLEDYQFHWTPEDGFQNRLIIPFFYQNRIVGYTARKITDGKPKYISEQQPGYVFNLDRQHYERKYVIVTEGPIDAICVDGVAVMSAEISASQHALISQLQREVIVIADRDDAGYRMVEQALEYGWSVSFPDWAEGIKDVNDANKVYGKLATLYSIISTKESNNLKIQLKSRKWFKKEET